MTIGSEKRFSRSQVISASQEYFGGDALAADVFLKYSLDAGKGNFLEESPLAMHKRLASEFFRIESKYPNPMTYEEILALLSRPAGRRFGMGPVVPQGSPMSGIGNKTKLQSLSNCFVIDSPEDSFSGIFWTDQEQAQIMKRRGGVGFDISPIRPKDMPTSNAAGTTDGIGVFMESFADTCFKVAQGGRRGALMLTISVKHPEIETFIHIKRDKKKVNAANVSIRVTDEFMRAVENDAEFTLQWPVDVPISDAKVVRVVRAKDIWEQMMDAAWDSAEPGILFWDTAKTRSPADAYESVGYGSISTNPCGEIVLSPYDSCRLLVVDLTHFVLNPFTQSAEFDQTGFSNTVIKAQRLLDDLIDLEIEAVDAIIQKVSNDPESAHKKICEIELWKRIRAVGARGRRTGLGITGLGDALAMLGVKYGSDDSIQMTSEIYKALAINAYKSSVRMARERGAFPVFDAKLEQDHPFIKQIMAEDDELRAEYELYGRRNIALTTTAPVGSVSLLTQTTSGIEPAFRVKYTRKRKISPSDKESVVDSIDDSGIKWTNYNVYHTPFKLWIDVTGKTEVSDSPYAGATADEIDWIASVRLQAAAQHWICHSISKTCNLPRTATHKLVSDCYLEAWKMGCKGFTIYRDGSREGVLTDGQNVVFDVATRLKGLAPEEIALNIAISEKYAQHIPMGYKSYIEDAKSFLNGKLGEPAVEAQHGAFTNNAVKRPKELVCDIHRVNVKGESYTVLVGLLDGAPYEVFCGLSEHVEIPKRVKRGRIVKNGKKDGVATYNLHIPVDEDEIIFKDIVNLFENPTYGTFTRTLSLSLRHRIPLNFIVEQLQKDKYSDMQSFSRVIARVLKQHIVDGTKASEKACESCKAVGTLVYEEGCMKCTSCGNGKCG